MDPPRGVRHPGTWDPSRVETVVERRGAHVLERCRPEGSGVVQVTAYVRAGRVLSAGVATDEEVGDEVLDCVAGRVRSWSMPSSRRTAKVTFELASPAQGAS